jgi:hypothetical protein
MGIRKQRLGGENKKKVIKGLSQILGVLDTMAVHIVINLRFR